MQMSKADKINEERIRETLRLERQLWRAEHPGRKFPGYTKEVIAWRIKRSVAPYDRRDKKMRKRGWPNIPAIRCPSRVRAWASLPWAKNAGARKHDVGSMPTRRRQDMSRSVTRSNLFAVLKTTMGFVLLII